MPFWIVETNKNGVMKVYPPKIHPPFNTYLRAEEYKDNHRFGNAQIIKLPTTDRQKAISILKVRQTDRLNSIHEFTMRPQLAMPKLNSIYHSNCVELMKTMDENFVDLTVTSPPYDELRNYNGYHFNFEDIAKNLFRITKNGGVLVWVVSDKIKNGNRSLTSFRQAIFFQEIGFNVHDVMIYKKRNTPFMRTNAYTNCFEFMFVFSKGPPKTFNPLKVKTVRQGQEMLPFNKGADGINRKILGELKPEKTMTNIWEYAVGLYGTTSDKIAFKHPAIFPEKLAEDHILSWTNEGDVVFDPMCGSGTTCKMALKNKRFYIGCDVSKEYVKLTEKRLTSWLTGKGWALSKIAISLPQPFTTGKITAKRQVRSHNINQPAMFEK